MASRCLSGSRGSRPRDGFRWVARGGEASEDTTVGTFVGMLLHYPYITLAMLGNVKRMDPGDGLRPDPAKLAPVSKIAQCVGTLRNQLSGFLLMELPGC